MTYSEFFMEIDVDRLLSKRLRKRITNQIKPGLIKEIRAELLDEVKAEVAEKMRDEVTDEVTAKVTDEVTAKVTDEVTTKVTDEVTGIWSRKLADVHSENEKLRELLRMHGIDEAVWHSCGDCPGKI